MPVELKEETIFIDFDRLECLSATVKVFRDFRQGPEVFWASIDTKRSQLRNIHHDVGQEAELFILVKRCSVVQSINSI